MIQLSSPLNTIEYSLAVTTYGIKTQITSTRSIQLYKQVHTYAICMKL